MPSYAAHLRVYEPVTALPDGERTRWTEYVRAGRAPERVAGMEAEHTAALAALLAVPPRPGPDGPDEAFVRVADGVAYVCPFSTRLRSLIALVDFRRGLPTELADAFAPPALVAAAEAELARRQAEQPPPRPAILTSTWQVPVPWFLLFEPHERRLVLGERRRHPQPTAARTELDRALLYVTAMARCRQRVARALHVLRRVLQDGPAVAGVEDLGRWLEEFHPHSLVELDYGGLVHLIDDGELSADDSVAALASALGHLAEGDTLAAAEAYERVTTRWRAVAALESAN